MRLKEDIDRSRQMYAERVDPSILRSTDYFYQKLVRILAGGDVKASVDLPTGPTGRETLARISHRRYVKGLPPVV